MTDNNGVQVNDGFFFKFMGAVLTVIVPMGVGAAILSAIHIAEIQRDIEWMRSQFTDVQKTIHAHDKRLDQVEKDHDWFLRQDGGR